jgi:hypothetical protein
MSNQPFGPFGPSYDGPPQTTPNPTVPTPVQNSSYAPVGIPAPADPYVGGYAGGSRATPGQATRIIATSAQGDFLLNLILVGCLWPALVCLYPLSAATGYLTLLFGAGLAIRFVPPNTSINPNLIASAIGFVAALVVLWNVSRFEHVLARSNAYRILRHAVRVALIAGVAVAAIERSQGISISYATPKLNFTHVLSDPEYLGTVVGVILASHFILWNWKWARDFWHRRLMAAQLRKRGT